MTPKINLLDEVVISTMTESEFKQKILETTPQLTLEEEAALENIRIINQRAKFASPLPMGSYEAYRDFLKGPQGIVIFSSNGSKGLVKAIKNIVRPPTYKSSSSFNRGSGKTYYPGFQKFSLVKMHTSKVDSIASVKK